MPLIQPYSSCLGAKLRTLLQVTKQFELSCSFRGSSAHFPSTKNLYSYLPGGIITVLFHDPFPSLFMGCVLGFQLLKSPSKITSFAWFDSNENVTLRRFIVRFVLIDGFRFDLIFDISSLLKLISV